MKTNEPIPTLALDDLLHMAASAIEDLLEHTDPNTSYYSGAWADVPGKLRAAAMLQAGNSQAIPEGYVMVPKEPTAEMVIKMRYHVGGYDRNIKEGYKAMLAVAPQLPGSESATVPGKWIPVSERMPEDDGFVYIWPRPDFGVELHVGQYCECSPKGDGWYAQVYEQNYGIEWHPITVTHWMPLPADPKEDINALIHLVSRNEQEGK